MPAAVVTFLVGVSAFAALGMAVAGLCPSASAASAVANAIILPMAFVSDVFIPLEDPPPWLDDARRHPAAEAVRAELPGHASTRPSSRRRSTGASWRSSPRGASSGVRRCAALVQVGTFAWRLDAPPASEVAAADQA